MESITGIAAFFGGFWALPLLPSLGRRFFGNFGSCGSFGLHGLLHLTGAWREDAIQIKKMKNIQ
jgi:hypothetical protein